MKLERMDECYSCGDPVPWEERPEIMEGASWYGSWYGYPKGFSTYWYGPYCDPCRIERQEGDHPVDFVDIHITLGR